MLGRIFFINRFNSTNTIFFHDICSGSYTTMRAKEPANNPGGTIMLQIEVLSPFKSLT